MATPLLLGRARERPRWVRALSTADPSLDIRGPELEGTLDDIELAVLWRAPAGLERCAALRVVFSIGAGVDQLGEVPEGVTLVRMVEGDLTAGMVEWVVMNALLHHRRALDYAEFQRSTSWQYVPAVAAKNRRVGLMGYGELGRACARALAVLGFPVAAWSRSRKTGIESYAGDDELDAFLARSDIVACLLPLTDATRSVLDEERMRRLPRGAVVLAAGRGGQVVEDDLLSLLDEGYLAGASIDVFEREPLPETSPLWRHPRVVLTPHVASLTTPEGASEVIARNIERFRRGEPLPHVVDRGRGY